MEDSTFTIDCFACNEPAATISFAEEPNFGLIIGQRGFMADIFAGMLGPHDADPRLFAQIQSLAQKDLQSLRAMDPDFFTFICGRCRVAYCCACWTDVHDTYDDGIYGHTLGTCPRGHEQSLQD